MSDSMFAPDEFDEESYLRAYPDVAEAVRAGHFASGRDHFVRCGRQEGRVGASGRRAAVAARAALVGGANVAGRLFAAEQDWAKPSARTTAPAPVNPLREFFERRNTGTGIWKWQHYFDVYHRYLNRFRGREVHVLEIGVYSGGSLEMWRDYFGPGAHIYGVDIEPACRAYETAGVKIFIGDQSDRDFWRRFRAEVPQLDIVIDDGGHLFGQQVATIEELLPHLHPGGVFICEDVHGEFHPFGSYAAGLANMLNAGEVTNHPEDNERRLESRTSPFQSAVAAVSFHPLMVVVEKTPEPVPALVAPKHGDQWQPFLH